jgi:hypothetical protein
MVEIVHKRFLSHLSQYLDENKVGSLLEFKTLMEIFMALFLP